MRTLIIVKTQFSAVHCWPECPFDEVSFLRYPHRHLFYVTVKFKVNHDHRDKEFLMVKNVLEKYISIAFNGKDLGSMSCETMARKIKVEMDADYVSVYEDNENGAEIYEED